MVNNYMDTETESQRMDDPGSRREGTMAKAIERQTAKLPSDTFLWTALGSVGLALALKITGKDQAANFVGQWHPHC